ncbi:MAG TPA: hypothetical protein VFJ16_18845 [Longimicrobium sp.]|nr:hypothetical protein [Longimicrobium sp.]
MKTIGNVTFRWRRRFIPAPGAPLTEKSKPCRWPLEWERAQNGKLRLSSQNVGVTWTVTARSLDGGEADMEGYRAGVTNTVLLSERSWYYR